MSMPVANTKLVQGQGGREPKQTSKMQSNCQNQQVFWGPKSDKQCVVKIMQGVCKNIGKEILYPCQQQTQRQCRDRGGEDQNKQVKCCQIYNRFFGVQKSDKQCVVKMMQGVCKKNVKQILCPCRQQTQRQCRDRGERTKTNNHTLFHGRWCGVKVWSKILQKYSTCTFTPQWLPRGAFLILKLRVQAWLTVLAFRYNKNKHVQTPRGCSCLCGRKSMSSV